jgi:hypothetical protein
MSVIVKALITVTRFPWNSKIWKPNSWCTKAEQYTCIYYNLALYITPVLFTYGMNITRLTRHMSLVEQELLNPPEQLSSPPFLVEFVFQSLVLCVCFVDRCLSFCTFSFRHCVVCSSSLYRLWIPLLTPLTDKLYYIMLYTSPCFFEFELTISVVTDTDCISSSKANYHTIMARTDLN